MRKNGRKPSDYPQFSFRITAERKDRLNLLVTEVTELYNKQVKDGEYLYRKNDIIARALEQGLTQLRNKQVHAFDTKK